MHANYHDSLNRIYKTLKHQEPDIVPVFSGMGSFAVGYANSTIQETESNWQKEVEVYLKPHKKLYCDAVHFAGIPYGPLGSAIIGSPSRFISPDGQTVQHRECSPMRADEYDKLIADPEDFIFNVCLPRTAKKLDMLYPQNYEVIKKFNEYLNNKFEAWAQISKKLMEEYHRVVLHDAAGVYPPLDLIFDYLRGFTGVSTDMRRQPEKLLAAIEAVEPFCAKKLGLGPEIEKVPEFPMFGTYFHCPTFLSPSQFEKFFVPSYERLTNRVHELGGKLILFLEGHWDNKTDYLNNLPKDFACGIIEADDIFEMKKKVGGNITLIGGMPVNMLKYNSVGECKEYVKKLINALAPNGGYMFGADKELCSKNDVNFNTMAEVFAFVHEYGKY